MPAMMVCCGGTTMQSRLRPTRPPRITWGNMSRSMSIKFPTERRVYVAGPDGKPVPDLLMVSVDLSNYRFV
jgi:hypothetical protein